MLSEKFKEHLPISGGCVDRFKHFMNITKILSLKTRIVIMVPQMSNHKLGKPFAKVEGKIFITNFSLK